MLVRTYFAAALLLVPSPTTAQRQNPVITGIVVDAEGRPLAGAEVFVGSTDTPVTSGTDGRFRIDPAPSGRLWVAARRIGYRPVRRAITLAKDARTELELVMDPLPVALPEVKVEALSGMRARRLNDFFMRSRGYGGRFITRDDIERRHAISLRQVVRPVLPWAALASWEQSSADRQPMRPFRSGGLSRTGRSRCAPALSLNGGLPVEGWMVEDIPIAEVEALEVYKPRWSEIPNEFAHNGRAQDCGLVVVWTR